MDNIIVITQNVKIESLHLLREVIKPGSETLVFSSQLIFNNEKQLIESELNSVCCFQNFSNYMTDDDFQKCDEDAFQGINEPLSSYYDRIKELKNQVVVSRILEKYPCDNCWIICDDLGIDVDVWLKKGFKFYKCEYYHIPETNHLNGSVHVDGVLHRLARLVKCVYDMPKYHAQWDGAEHVFYGSLNRIAYRLSINFVKSGMLQSLEDVFLVLCGKVFKWVPASKKVRLSTLHERGIGYFIDSSNLNLKLIQDGYLPPNYSSKYLLFSGTNIEYYTWDKEGSRTFEYHNLPHRIIPYRKKLFLPLPKFPQNVKKVLCVASGAGDWTALKNRSDEDKMIEVFGKVAAAFPNIEFIYRCHPVWIHPVHQGVNSINRAAEYIHWLNLPNFRISSNIPNAEENGKFRLSYKRSSFEEDLKDVDVVFGEHSISMIDAAFKKILFCSVNVTGRRDFFMGITQMGFPHCESLPEITNFLLKISSPSFKTGYKKAIENYNRMTDQED